MGTEAAAHGMTEEEFGNLTEEERAAFSEVPDDEKEAIKAAAEDKGSPEEGKKESEEGDKVEEEQGKPAEEGGKPAVTAPESEAKPEAQPQPGQFVPVFQSTVKVDEITTELAELDKQYTEGELDMVEYTNKRETLIEARTEARMAQTFNKQSQEQYWQFEQKVFFDGHPEYRTDSVLHGALQATLRKLETEDVNREKTGLQLLNEARELIEKRFKSSSENPVKDQGDPKKEDPPRDKRSALDKAELPQTLATTPVASENDTGQGEFDYLDKLEGIELEKAISKLTKDQAERYLRGN